MIFRDKPEYHNNKQRFFFCLSQAHVAVACSMEWGTAWFSLKNWRKGKKFVNSLVERKLCITFVFESDTNVIQSNTEIWRRQ